MADVNEITFGIEVECTLPFGRINNVGGYHRGEQVPEFPAGWNAQHDGSIVARTRRQMGVEIVSGILKGAEGLRQVKQVLSQLSQWGATVNRTCGFHVHVGFPNDAKQVDKLTFLVANFEKALYASTGTKAREMSHYCNSIRSSYRGATFAAPAPAHHCRYHSLNLSNLLCGRPTVEFRAFAGTLNFQKIAGYIRMCVGLVERALTVTRKTNWDAKAPVASSPIHRSGEGQTVLTRLFYQLGWTKGRQKHVFGDLSGDGLPRFKTTKRTLMQLARKYDRG